MKEKPILFSTPMVQAILEGRKTQTRRIVKPQPESEKDNGESGLIGSCPFGQIGNVLWVRETFCPVTIGYAYKADGVYIKNHPACVWKPSIHMPREACRLFLEITNIRVERLQDITGQDSFSEGIKLPSITPQSMQEQERIAKHQFEILWQSINGAESWQSNPFVWVIEFKKL